MQLCWARSSGARGGRRRAKYVGAPTTATFIGRITRTAIMKEKELRFALVCYGGVSLVLYMSILKFQNRPVGRRLCTGRWRLEYATPLRSEWRS